MHACWSLTQVAFGVLIFILPRMAGAGQIKRPFRILSYASGLVDAANLTLYTASTFECSLQCLERRICSAFSVSKQSVVSVTDGSSVFECIITFGSFTWTTNETYSLFMEDIGLPSGYNLEADGKFYKLRLTAQDPRRVRAACMAEGGNLAVPYPNSVRLMVQGAAVKATGSYFVGISQCTNRAADWLWCTDEGGMFNSTNKANDPNQLWQTGEPSGSGLQVSMDVNGSWNDVNETLATAFGMCRKFKYYTQSPVAGIYHKVHYTLTNAASAAAVCASEGGTLANAYGSQNYEALRGYRRQLRTVTTNALVPPFFLIGGTDSATEGLWVFPDGSTMDVSQRVTDLDQVWTAGFNGSSLENCLVLANGGFEDVPCGSANRFLCEIRV